MSEEPKGNKRGDLPNGGENTKGADRSFFQANGLEHFGFSAKKTITIGFLVGIIYFIGYLISSYKLALSEIDARLIVNPEIIEMKLNIKNIKETLSDHESRLRNNEAMLNSRRK